MTFSNEYPDFFARFYDLIYDHIRSSEDHDYFMDKLRSVNGPVLEVGVGTGRFFKEALDHGVDIHGIDNSPAMINILKQKLDEENYFRVSTQDVCKLKSDRNYSLIIAPFRVFMHLLTKSEQQRALNSIYKKLKPGGKFIFDLFVPNLKMLCEGLDNVMDYEGEYESGRIVRRYTSMNADIINQISNVSFKLIWDENGQKVTKIWNTRLRFFFRYELEYILEKSSFDSYEIYGDFQEKKLHKESKEFVVVCTK